MKWKPKCRHNWTWIMLTFSWSWCWTCRKSMTAFKELIHLQVTERRQLLYQASAVLLKKWRQLLYRNSPSNLHHHVQVSCRCWISGSCEAAGSWEAAASSFVDDGSQGFGSKLFMFCVCLNLLVWQMLPFSAHFRPSFGSVHVLFLWCGGNDI